MRRPHVIAAIAVAIVLFLVISALLARVFSANSAEQAAITALVQAEARGDTPAIISDITGCQAAPACRQRAGANAASLKHAGSVTIVQLTPSTNFSIAGTLGTARVAWTVGNSLPFVQCVRVRRRGNVLSGLHVELLVVSARIKSDADCPARF